MIREWLVRYYSLCFGTIHISFDSSVIFFRRWYNILFSWILIEMRFIYKIRCNSWRWKRFKIYWRWFIRNLLWVSVAFPGGFLSVTPSRASRCLLQYFFLGSSVLAKRNNPNLQNNRISILPYVLVMKRCSCLLLIIYILFFTSVVTLFKHDFRLSHFPSITITASVSLLFKYKACHMTLLHSRSVSGDRATLSLRWVTLVSVLHVTGHQPLTNWLLCNINVETILENPENLFF